MITIRDVKLSVKKMKRWQLEAVRITIYLGVPLFMYGVSGMPKVQEYVYNSVRADHLERRGVQMKQSTLLSSTVFHQSVTLM
ncbi:unnamed protein product [Heterobilharzia americana]|nr:unnamed protein product [Heterobilharzia americana]